MLDHDVDAAVGSMLRRRGHDAWSASDAGLATASDDELTVYAHDQRAVLLTHDREFSQRRRTNVIGRHVWLRCLDTDAVKLLEEHLDEIVSTAFTRDDMWVRVSNEGIETSSVWT
ncbi:DUF5615 family PIN-like protein [Pseudonocardia kongjuensis]|uniref:DUF5615 family PIN-like protein n=1 Tax=Pseudonocardia kongjuensis TaxID=102227 RepID=UPI0031E2E257